MDQQCLHRAVVEMCRREPVMKLDALLRREIGVGLFILLPHSRKKYEMVLQGEEAPLPEFCRTIHATEDGQKKCLTCRSLLGVAAFNRGLIEHTCHGGVAVLAAPVRAGGADIVVTSCAYRNVDHLTGWKLARAHARGLSVNMDKLKRAYERLPRLDTRKVELCRGVLDVAAAMLNEGVRRMYAEDGTRRSLEEMIGKRKMFCVEEQFESAMKDAGNQVPRRTRAEMLVEIVRDVVGRNPGMPFTVQNIASAARVTPNHFSSLFHRHAGMTFVKYLTRERITLACERLADLTLSIGDVAAEVGFDDNSYFVRRFRDQTGMTPGQYRQRLKGKRSVAKVTQRKTDCETARGTTPVMGAARE